MKLLDRIQTYFWKRRLHKEFDAVKENFEITKCPQKIEKEKTYLDNDKTISFIIYKDKMWNHIKNMHQYLNIINRGLSIKHEDNCCGGQKYQIVNGNKVNFIIVYSQYQ